MLDIPNLTPTRQLAPLGITVHEAYLSRALELTCLSHSSLSACGALRPSSLVKNRMVASFDDEAM
jgi:hypothetical protein